MDKRYEKGFSSNGPELLWALAVTQFILHPPFEWCNVKGGSVTLENAIEYGGTKGGTYQVDDFAIAKYPITNAQYEKFIKNSNGFSNPQWWEYSSAAIQWRKDHKNPKPTAFNGLDLPRTRVSWFDNVAFCLWLSTELMSNLHNAKPMDIRDVSTWIIRLPTEQEWQRAALGDMGWRYPWGDTLDETRGNYGKKIGQPSSVTQYPMGKSIYNVMDQTGNVWERCLIGQTTATGLSAQLNGEISHDSVQRSLAPERLPDLSGNRWAYSACSSIYAPKPRGIIISKKL